jgi:two-component system chemotaxis response regulator CheB
MVQRIIAIGASLSGVAALTQLVRSLPSGLPAAVLIAQHVASHSPGFLPQILSSAGHLPAVHPADGEKVAEGQIYVAPPDRHMLMADGSIRLSHGPKENLARPAIDPLFRSVALAYGNRAIGVILTGQLDDGTAGLLAIKDCGGIAVVQEPHEATAPSMPLSALRHIPVDYRCRLEEMGPLLTRLVATSAPADPTGPETLLAIEGRIAAGDFRLDDWWELERMSAPAGLNCPDCRSAVYEMNDKRVLRFRCRSGHAFSAESLASGQSEARYNLLSSLFGALIEETTLLKRLAEGDGHGIERLAAAQHRGEAQRLQAQTEQVCEWLRSMAGLVEPELAVREHQEDQL